MDDRLAAEYIREAGSNPRAGSAQAAGGSLVDGTACSVDDSTLSDCTDSSDSTQVADMVVLLTCNNRPVGRARWAVADNNLAGSKPR